MVFSQVSIEESLRVKKRFYVADIDEYNGCSEPLNNVVLSTVLSAIPSKSSSKKLKAGYIVDLTRDGGISPCSLILGLLYIKRLSQTSPAFFSILSSRELFLVSMLVSSKYLNDEGEMEALTNTDFSSIGCMPRKRLDHLEVKFLEAIGWRLFVSVEEYYQFVTSVEGRVALNQACQRGWFSYTDLCAVWESSDVQDVMLSVSKTTTKVACGSALLYLVCVATLFASTPQPACDHTLTTLSPGNIPLDESSSNLTVFKSDTPLNLTTSQTSPLLRKPPDLFSLDSLGMSSILLNHGKTRKYVIEDSCKICACSINSSFDVIEQSSATDLDSVIISESFVWYDWKKDFCAFDETLTGSGHCIEPGLLLLLDLTAAFTSPEFLTPDHVSSSHQFNTLTTILLNPDEYTRNNNFNPDIDTSAGHNNTNSTTYSNCNFGEDCSHVESNTGTFKESHEPTLVPQSTDEPYLSDNDSKTTPYKAKNDLDSLQYAMDYHKLDFNERNSSPYPNEFRSPVVVIEMIPVVTGSPPWDYNHPVRPEKSNFTLIDMLGILAQGILAW